ncbi:MAG: D-alanyl-D-alanine carboxypeptidase [Firmicutes bacterium]|nr:D-alanyl-D-alanine carboxypeptidase [Bacillota bacterium]
MALLFPSTSAAATTAADPSVPANIRAAILYNPSSQQVLWARNAQQPLYPASLTKLLTALIVVRHAANLDSVTQVSQTAARQEPVDLVMKPGTQVTLREMMYGAIPSANDAVCLGRSDRWQCSGFCGHDERNGCTVGGDTLPFCHSQRSP